MKVTVVGEEGRKKVKVEGKGDEGCERCMDEDKNTNDVGVRLC